MLNQVLPTDPLTTQMEIMVTYNHHEGHLASFIPQLWFVPCILKIPGTPRNPMSPMFPPHLRNIASSLRSCDAAGVVDKWIGKMELSNDRGQRITTLEA